jgi:uncharacterized coiled-coil DUF342 family protein
MSSEKGNGHDPITVQMVEILQKIHGEIAGLRREFNDFRDETRGELTDIRGELREIHHEIADTNVRLTTTNERLEDLRSEMRAGFRRESALDVRVTRLEEAVFKPAAA